MSQNLCPSCGSCGFPMRTPDDQAGGNPEAAFCSTCAEASGQLRPYAVVVQANADYLVQEQGIDIQAALAMARALLDSMPAWKERP